MQHDVVNGPVSTTGKHRIKLSDIMTPDYFQNKLTFSFFKVNEANMIAIVVHLELPLMFGFKILIKLKSEITGLKNKYCCVPPFIHFLVDRGRNVHVYRNEQHISFKLQTQSLKNWDCLFNNECYSPLARNKLFIFSHHGYLLESEEFLSFYRNPVVHHSLFSLSITIGSGTDLLSSSDADNDKILRG